MWMMLAVRWGSVGYLCHEAAPGVDSLHFPDKPAPVPPSDGPQGPGTGLEGQWMGIRSVPGARGTYHCKTQLTELKRASSQN